MVVLISMELTFLGAYLGSGLLCLHNITPCKSKLHHIDSYIFYFQILIQPGTWKVGLATCSPLLLMLSGPLEIEEFLASFRKNMYSLNVEKSSYRKFT